MHYQGTLNMMEGATNFFLTVNCQFNMKFPYLSTTTGLMCQVTSCIFLKSCSWHIILSSSGPNSIKSEWRWFTSKINNMFVIKQVSISQVELIDRRRLETRAASIRLRIGITWWLPGTFLLVQSTQYPMTKLVSSCHIGTFMQTLCVCHPKVIHHLTCGWYKQC